MATTVVMEALSPTMEEGRLVKWTRAVGDAVKSGETLAEVETDKATMDYESASEGTLLKIVVPAGGQAIPVAASTSAGPGSACCAPRRVVAAAPAAQAPRTAASGADPAASATASAPTNASPAMRPIGTIVTNAAFTRR